MRLALIVGKKPPFEFDVLGHAFPNKFAGLRHDNAVLAAVTM